MICIFRDLLRLTMRRLQRRPVETGGLNLPLRHWCGPTWAVPPLRQSPGREQVSAHDGWAKINHHSFPGIPMARQCEACGKSVQMGNRVETRGKAKYLGGVGTKITGITRRKFVPNLQRIHVTLPNGQNKTMRVCTQCIRSGVVRKTVKTKPFDVGQHGPQ